jgi:hypothetical protein
MLGIYSERQGWLVHNGCRAADLAEILRKVK